jgi:hypothetical protein
MHLKRDSIIPWGCVFKITFPNKKIYVGSDTALTARLDYFKYFGSPQKAKREMLIDMEEFLNGEKACILKREILYACENVTVGEILRIERKFIKPLSHLMQIIQALDTTDKPQFVCDRASLTSFRSGLRLMDSNLFTPSRIIRLTLYFGSLYFVILFR